MRSFYVHSRQVQNGFVTIAGQDARHLGKVLRLGPGEAIKIFDGSGIVYLVKLITVKTEEAVGEIIGEEWLVNEPALKVNLIQGLPKQGKMELIVQKCTELGVRLFYPVLTERTEAKLEAAVSAGSKDKTERWQKVAVEAVKQCGRSIVPLILPVQTLDMLLETIGPGKEIIMLYEGERIRGLKPVLLNWVQEKEKPELFVLIGPEGGFSSQEAGKVLAAGGHVVTLGPRILRTETAGMAVVSSIMYQLGDLGG